MVGHTGKLVHHSPLRAVKVYVSAVDGFKKRCLALEWMCEK